MEGWLLSGSLATSPASPGAHEEYLTALDYHFIFPKPDEPGRILGLQHDGRPVLPGWRSPGSGRTGSWASELADEIHRRWQLRSRVLHWDFNERDGVTNELRTVFVMEVFGDGPLAEPGTQWLDRREAEGLTPGSHAGFAERYFREVLDGETPDYRQPWQRPGWFADAEDWIHRQLATHGLRPKGPLAQLKTQYATTILRAHTASVDAYFKAVPPAYGWEPTATAVLARRFPDRLPTVIAVDAARKWMLTADYGGQALADERDVRKWTAAIRSYAVMQRSAGQQLLAELRDAGCPDMRLAPLQSAITELLSDLAIAPTVQRPTRQELLARVAAAVERLDALGLQPTLEHGDLHAGNLVWNAGRTIVVDWENAAIAQPFLGLVRLLTHLRTVLPEHPAASSSATAEIRDAYLSEWLDRAPIKELRKVFALAIPLGLLAQAVTYHRYPFERMHLRWERAGLASALVTAADAALRATPI
jgi:hypothetical protein